MRPKSNKQRPNTSLYFKNNQSKETIVNLELVNIKKGYIDNLNLIKVKGLKNNENRPKSSVMKNGIIKNTFIKLERIEEILENKENRQTTNMYNQRLKSAFQKDISRPSSGILNKNFSFRFARPSTSKPSLDNKNHWNIPSSNKINNNKFLNNVGGVDLKSEKCFSTTYDMSTDIGYSSITNNTTTIAFSRPVSHIRPMSGFDNSNIFSQKARPITSINRKKININQGQANNFIQVENQRHNQQTIRTLIEGLNNKNQISFATGKSKPQSKEVIFPLVNKLIKEYNEIEYVDYSIKLQSADTDLLEIFDRSQRTKAATMSKVGDYDYYTPCQRIGSFVEYSLFLKYEDVKNIEKHVNYHKNQPTFLMSKKSQHIVDFTSDPKMKTNQYANSLFHGFMRYEADIEEYYLQIGVNNLTFDPTKFIHIPIRANIYDINTYSNEQLRQLINSINNYNKYINSDKIRSTDIEPFNKLIKRKILRKLEERLISNKIFSSYITLCFKEVEKGYYLTMKNIIMQYIIRSPHERQRLNIPYFPKSILPSSYTIAYYGGFNRLLYYKWVSDYHQAKKNMTKKLYNINLFGSSIIDWTKCFEHVDLFFYSFINTSEYNIHSNSVNISNYLELQSKYLYKSIRFLKDIYYRGVNLILKLNKKFILKGISPFGKWTFKGFVPFPKYSQKGLSYKKEKPLYSDNYHKTYVSSSYINENTYLISNENYISKEILSYKNNIYNDTDDLNIIIKDKQEEITHYFINNIDITEMIYTPEYQMGINDELSDFFSSCTINELIDIRVNPSYYTYECIIKNRKIDLDNNILDSSYTPEEAKRLYESISVYVQIFLRQILNNSLNKFLKFFKSFRLIDEILVDVDKMHEQYGVFELEKEVLYTEKDIRLPEIKAFKLIGIVNPIIDIKLNWDKKNFLLKFESSFDSIIEKIIELIDLSQNMLNMFLSPIHLYFDIVKESEFEKAYKEHFQKLNKILNDPKQQSHSEEYYKEFAPNINLKEENVKDLFSKSFLKVSEKTEEIFLLIKAKLSRCIKKSYVEIEESLILFDSLKEVISGGLSNNIQLYINKQKSENKKDYNKIHYFVEKIRMYKKYIHTIPNYVYFSLFIVDMTTIKSNILSHLNEDLQLLLSSIEVEINELYNGCIDRYAKIIKQIDRKLNTPEELVAMESLKLGLVNEIGLINKNYDEAYKLFHFLMQIDHIFIDESIRVYNNIINRHLKFKSENEE